MSKQFANLFSTFILEHQKKVKDFLVSRSREVNTIYISGGLFIFGWFIHLAASAWVGWKFVVKYRSDLMQIRLLFGIGVEWKIESFFKWIDGLRQALVERESEMDKRLKLALQSSSYKLPLHKANS